MYVNYDHWFMTRGPEVSMTVEAHEEPSSSRIEIGSNATVDQVLYKPSLRERFWRCGVWQRLERKRG